MMKLEISDKRLPGTTVLRDAAGGKSGEKFLDRIFFLTDGIMLSQIKEISGVDGTTLQNWVKRGWIGNTVNKKYSKNQLARILIINMMRETMQLEKIDYLLRYVNGKPNCEEDDIISEARLYGYICHIIDRLSEYEGGDPEKISELACDAVADYTEKLPGARDRLEKALAVIITSYYASLVKGKAQEFFLDLK